MTAVRASHIVVGMTISVTPIQLWAICDNKLVPYEMVINGNEDHLFDIDSVDHIEVDVYVVEPCTYSGKDMVKIVHHIKGGQDETVYLLSDESVTVSQIRKPKTSNKNRRKRALALPVNSKQPMPDRP